MEQRWDGELERRGIAAVTVLLSKTGSGPGAMVQLGLGGGNPTHDYVATWLGRKEAEAAALAERRYRENLKPAQEGAKWAKWAFVASAIAAALALVALVK